jgi:Uma2 family endonuclease
MSTSARRVHYTYAEYLTLEDESSVRHEYLDGEIYAMAGGSPDHAALAAALIRILGSSVPPGCRVFTSGLRVRIWPPASPPIRTPRSSAEGPSGRPTTRSP